MEFDDFNPLIVNCYYAIFVIDGVSTNGLLIYLIGYRSSRIVWSLKAMMINISATQILITLTAGLLQGRMMSNSSTTAILSEGPFRMLGPMASLVGYTIINAFTFYVELLIVHTMFWRYRKLQARQIKTVELLVILFLIAIWPVLLLVLPHIGSLRFDLVTKETIIEHRNYNLKKYGDIGGFETGKFVQTVCGFIACAIAIASPILILLLRRLIMKLLSNTLHQYSEKTVQSSRMFLKALTIQAMVPIICFLPTISLSVLAMATGSEASISEYLRICIATLPCVIDPLIAFYFVPPYREWVLEKLCRRPISRKMEPKSTTVSTPNRTIPLPPITTY